MTLSIAIAGAAGRMGQALIHAARAAGDLRIAGATERAGAATIGQDIGALAGLPAAGIAITADPAAALRDADIWIDFTTPQSTADALAALRNGKTRVAIIGTTGLDEAQEASIRAAAAHMAVVRSGNFSLGVNLLAALVRRAASALGPDWDIEILETHHRRKVDAPSGTALLLAEAAAAGRNVSLSNAKLAPRDGITGARPEGGIGFAVRRGGGVFGEHEVMFASEREVLRLSHDALDRAVFADGALAAARWAASQKPGFYTMSDVLGL